MDDFNFEKFDHFLEDYRLHSSCSTNGTKHISEASDITNLSSATQLLYYKSQDSLSCVTYLVVSSIFNSVEILFLNSQTHFVDRLRALGDVYVIKWLEVEDSNFDLSDYTREVTGVLKHLTSHKSQGVNLIGHCIGGTIAYAATVLAPQSVESLCLLTTPWDFSHFKQVGNFHKSFDLDKKIKDLKTIPAIYMQILFFLLSPEYFSLKTRKYYDLTHEADKQLFMQVENWLMSGTSIPASTYFQVTGKLMIENILAKGQWIINSTKIDIEGFCKPLFMMIAKNDQLAPRNSILPLYQGIKDVNLIELDGGHISYLIGSQLDKFFKQYNNWLKGGI